MNGVTFFPAGNGSLSCRAAGITLHSSYNPEREAGRFAEGLSCPFVPEFVLVTEPALSYCADFLKKRFPSAELCAVRYCRAFQEYDKKWSRVFYFERGDSPALFAEKLFASLGEEGLCSCLAAAWQPSARAFPETDRAVWESIQSAVVKSRTVLLSRSYFAARGLKNALAFCLSVQTQAQLRRGSMPVVVTASGPSLGPAVPLLRQSRDSFFLIAVSSSLSVLLASDLVPDLVISTDSGWWAKKHLEALRRRDDIVLAVPPEGGCDRQILERARILPLRYDDGPESAVAEACGIRSMRAERNGTVSGTAAVFALSVTTGSVFLCGLDLSESEGFQHAQPNRIEIMSAARDCRLRPKELRQTQERFGGGAMRIYREWFSTRTDGFAERVFRLSRGRRFPDTLGAVRDVGFDALEAACRADSVRPQFTFRAAAFSRAERGKIIAEFLEKAEDSDEWLHNAFPAEYLGWKRCADAEEKARKAEALRRKNETLTASLRRAARV